MTHSADLDAVLIREYGAVSPAVAAAVTQALAHAWDLGYTRGVCDEAGDREHGPNPYGTYVTPPGRA